MLRVVLHKLLCAVPNCGNSFHILVKANYEAIQLLVLSHVAERIELDVAKDLDAGLNPPIPLIFLEQRLAKKEA